MHPRLGSGRWLYAQVSSSVVWSGRSLTSAWSNEMSPGECQPSPLSFRTHTARLADPLHPAHERVHVEREPGRHFFVRLRGVLERAHGPLAEFDGIRFAMRVIDHGSITSSSELWEVVGLEPRRRCEMAERVGHQRGELDRSLVFPHRRHHLNPDG